MAKLTDRQRNNILAKWHTGQFTKTELAKQYKVTEKVIRNVVDNQQPKNVGIIEAGAIVEIAKKSEKSPIETAEINKAIAKRVKELSIADEIEQEVFGGTLDIVKSVRKKIQLQEVETMQEHRHAQATLDQALITSGKADRHAPKQDINLTNAQQVNTRFVGMRRMTEEEKRKALEENGRNTTP